MRNRFGYITVAVVLAAISVMGVSAGVSAHEVTDIQIEVSCATRQVTGYVDYQDLSDDRRLNITVDVEGFENYANTGVLNGSGRIEFGPYPIDYDTGNVTVTAEVIAPDYSVESKKVQSVLYNCPSPVYAPKAKILGPCGDPMYGWFMNNRGSDRAVTFKVSFTKFGGDRVVKYRTVAAKTRVWSGFKHVEGRTSIVIRARGKTLANIVTAPNGNYQSCEALLAKYKANNP